MTITRFRPTDQPLERFLGSVGRVFQRFATQDSGCVSFGVEIDADRWFVKGAVSLEGQDSLVRAKAFHGAVSDDAIVPLVKSFTSEEGPAHVMQWIDGETLYRPAALRRQVDSSRSGFWDLSVADRLGLAHTVIRAHLAVVDAGFVAVDLYDGCFLFDGHAIHLIDLDEYRPGPFKLAADRLPGSTRFMAPEEFVRGSVIDERTTVFNLGRAIQELVPDLPDSLGAVAAMACRPDPEDRHQTVSSLLDDYGCVADLD